MKRNITLKMLSILLSASLALGNLAFADLENSDTLATKSKIESEELRNRALITANVRQQIKPLNGIDLRALQGIGDIQIVRDSVFTKKSASESLGTINFDQTVEIAPSQINGMVGEHFYVVRSVFGAIEYAAIISVNQRGLADEIAVIPYKAYSDANTAGQCIVLEDYLDKDARAAINSYVDHEVGNGADKSIDNFIRENMLRGGYIVSAATRANPLYTNSAFPSYDDAKLEAMIGQMKKFLAAIGVPVPQREQIISNAYNKPLVFIPYNDFAELPMMTIGGKNIRVTAHSSEFATYIFIPAAVTGPLTTKSATLEHKDEADIETTLIHEICGARCGLPVRVEGRKVENAIDVLYKEFVAQSTTESTPARLQIGPGYIDIVKNLKPVNLLDLEVREDYAAGHSAELFSMFKKAFALLVGGGMAYLNPSPAQGTAVTPPELSKAAPIARTKTVSANDINLDGSNWHSSVGGALVDFTPLDSRTGIEKCRYTTNDTDSWAGFGYNYRSRPEGYIDLSPLNDIRIYIKNTTTSGTLGNFKIEFKDKDGGVHTVYPPNVYVGGVYVFDHKTFPINISRITDINFIAEGPNVQGEMTIGTKHINPLSIPLTDPNAPGRISLPGSDYNITVPAPFTTTNLTDHLIMYYDFVTTPALTYASLGINYRVQNNRANYPFIDISAAPTITFGLRAPAATVKVEFADKNGNQAAGYTYGVSNNLQYFEFSPNDFPTVNFGQLDHATFTMEESDALPNTTGEVWVYHEPYPRVVTSSEVTTLTLSDVNLPRPFTCTSSSPDLEITPLPEGFDVRFLASAPGSRVFDFNYDNPDTPGTTETIDLSRSEYLVMAVAYENLNQIRYPHIFLTDADGNRNYVAIQVGNYMTYPNYFQIPVRQIYDGRVDLSRIVKIEIGEVNNESVKTPFSVKFYTTNRPSAVDAPWQMYSETPAPRVPHPAELTAMKNVLLGLEKEPPSPQLEMRMDQIAKLLWGSIVTGRPKSETLAELKRLSPEMSADKGEAFYGAAFDAVTSLGVNPGGSFDAPTDNEILKIAANIAKDKDQQIFIRASQIPKGMEISELRSMLGDLGSSLRVYENIGQLEGMMNHPGKSIVMTIGLGEKDIEELEKIEGVASARFLNYENVNVNKMNATQYNNYIFELIATLAIVRAISPEEASDTGSAMYRLLANILEAHAPQMNDVAMQEYIFKLASDVSKVSFADRMVSIIKNALKPVAPQLYNFMNHALAVFWSV